MTDKTEPTTEAGRNFIVEVDAAAHRGGGLTVAETRLRVLAIEAEARASEHERAVDACARMVIAAKAEARAGGLDVELRAAAVQLRAAAVKAGAHIVVTTDYPDGVKAFGILCDAIDRMDAILAETEPGT